MDLVAFATTNDQVIITFTSVERVAEKYRDDGFRPPTDEQRRQYRIRRVPGRYDVVFDPRDPECRTTVDGLRHEEKEQPEA